MRILFFANGYPSPKYPFQAFIGVICRELVRQGHHVTVIAPSSITTCLKHHQQFPPKYYTDTIGGGKWVEVYCPRTITFGFGKFAKWSCFFQSIAIKKIVQQIQHPFDVAYAHFWISGYRALDSIVRLQLPLFVASGEDIIEPLKWGYSSKISELEKFTKGVICVSTKNKLESIEKGLTTEDKCVILPNGIHVGEFYKMDKLKARQELGFPQDAFVVAYCGRFCDRKGAFRLAEALNQCENVSSIFIGKPSEGSALLPKCPQILFVGSLAHEDVCVYLNAADVYVLPTRAEGCSNSIVEAMACGLPIISSDLPFNYDILDESNAILINPDDVGEIKDAIVLLQNDAKRREEMARASLKKASRLSIENRTKRIVEFIKTKL